MFSFLKNKPKEERTVCVMIVNSYSVTAAVVRTYHRESAVSKPVVLFSCEEKIPHHYELAGNHLDNLVTHQTKKVLEKCRMVHGNYDKIVCVVGEPWVLTKTRHISVSKPTAFKITQKIIDDAIVRDTRLFEQEALREYAQYQEWGIMHSEKPVVDVNGYRVDSAIGITAKEMNIHVSTSLAPSAFIEMIMGIYADVFHRVDISFIGIDTVIAQLAKFYPSTSVISLGGTSGTFSVFTNGVFEYSETVHQGLSDFENALVYLFGVTHNHINSIMKFASDEKILDHERDIYYQRIETAYKNISDELRMAVLRLKKHVGHIPEPVLVVASPKWISNLRSLIEADVDTPVIIPDNAMFHEALVYTHEARAHTLTLSLAILLGIE